MVKFNRYNKLGFFLIFPQLVITAIFFIWPALKAFFQAFFFGDAFGLHLRFAGLINFLDLMRDPNYKNAVWVSLIIAFFITLSTMTFGLLMAQLVANRKKSQSTYKTLLLWPYAVAPAVAAILWRFLCQPHLGWLAQTLQSFGIPFNYLTNSNTALVVIILAGSWQQFSYNFLFFFAAILAIPPSLIEAAILDGAGAWRRFWEIIFPLLSPTTFFLLVMNLIYSFFDSFGIIDVLTKGGPNNGTTTMIYKVYQDGFVGMDFGSSCAQSILLMFLVMGLTMIQFRYLEKRVHYE